MCQYCDGKFAEYQRTHCVTLSMGTFGKHRTLEVSACKCPPFVDCYAKDCPANSAFIINYCPNCGRKLSDGAGLNNEEKQAVLKKWRMKKDIPPEKLTKLILAALLELYTEEEFEEEFQQVFEEQPECREETQTTEEDYRKAVDEMKRILQKED